jgi:PEGA domain
LLRKNEPFELATGLIMLTVRSAMSRRLASITAAVIAAACAATPALAQNRHDRTPSSEGRAEAQRARPVERAPERVEPNRAVPRAQERRAERGNERGDARGDARRGDERGDRWRAERRDGWRGEERRGERSDGWRAERSEEWRRPYYSRPYYSRPYYAAPYYARPYVFRPRLRLGLGILVGYPVPYAYAYPYPVPVYGYYAPPAPVIVGPSSTQYGGVSLEISPSDASVYVDGGYAGFVRDFDGTRETLTLAVGRHRIEIAAPGYEPMSFDVDVLPGQIVPYQGSLQPQY